MHTPVTFRPALAAAVLALALVQAVQAGADPISDRDLAAIRFYLAEGDNRSVQAELRRLRLQFPDWTPPEDLAQLLVTAPSQEIDQVFRRIARGETAEARALLAETRARFPQWEPPAEMMALLDTAEAQAAFDRAVAGAEARAAIDIARRTPQLLACDRINNAWQLAEMYLALPDPANAMATFRGIVASCNDRDELTATLEKANDIATEEELAALVETLRERQPQAESLWLSVEARLRAGRGLAPRVEGAPVTAQVPPDDRPATPAPAPAAPAPAPAAQAPGAAPPAAPAAGAPAGLPAGGDGRLGQVRAAAARGAWAECLRLSENARSAAVVYERAWCAYNADRPLEALNGFRIAARAGLGATVTRDAHYGMLLAMLASNMTEDAARLAARVDLTRQQRVDVEGIIIDQRGVRAYRMGRFREAIAFFDAHEALTGALRRDLALLRGYAYLNLGNIPAARAEFERLHRQLATRETREALARLP